MKLRFSLIIGLVFLGGCNLSIPNGLFGCGQPSDCPTGFFCWSSDSRCYDSKEPECAPRGCEEIIADFASLGIPIECGSLPDGCEGSVECGGCPPGEACGANGQNFLCGCEESTCATFAGGAECGVIPTRCGGEEEEALFCGSCLGDQVCVDNRCICPPGANCGEGCGDACGDNEVCVGGECCEPTYPCSENECSPPGGLPDGCGGVTFCNECGADQDCVLSDDLVYECLGDCTCEAQGVECGSDVICGSPTLCGTCEGNGFDEGYRCDRGTCICKDPYERNDDFDEPTQVCGLGAATNCMQDVWGVEVPGATLHHEQDVDVYALRVLNAETPIVAHVTGGFSDRILYMTYICPNGDNGIENCSGWGQDIQGLEVCVAEGDSIAMERKCSSGSGSTEGGEGTLLVAVAANEFEGDCDPYHLSVFASYQPGIPPPL